MSNQAVKIAKTSLLILIAVSCLYKGTAQAQTAPLINTQSITSTLLIAQTPATTAETAAEKVKKLKAAALTVDDLAYTSSKIKVLREIAIALAELNEKDSAISLLKKADSIAKQDPFPRAAEDYPSRLAAIATTYSAIGETNTADTLLQKALTLTIQTDSGSKSAHIAKIATAYAQLNNPQQTKEGFDAILNYIEQAYSDDQIQNIRASEYITQPIATWYGQSTDSEIANREIAHLQSIALKTLEATASTDPDLIWLHRQNKATLLGQIATAYAQQNNQTQATEIAAQAIASIPGETSYAVSETAPIIAAAYGELSNHQTATAGLTELTALVQRRPTLNDRKFTALAALARAHHKTNNQTAAIAITDSLAQQIQTQQRLNDKLPYLHQLADLYKEIGEHTAQQATYQQIFLTVDSVTLEYPLHNKALDSLIDSYIQVDNNTAEANFATLEALIRQSDEHYNGIPTALGKLAIAAQAKGNYSTAQQLLTEATQFIANNPDIGVLSPNFSALHTIAKSYSAMPDIQIKQTGLETVRSLGQSAVPPRLRPLIGDMVTRVEAGLGPWL